MDKLRVSKYLKTVNRNKDYAVYHSLFGNLSLLDSDGYDLLRSFDVPRSSSEVIRIFSCYAPLLLIQYINNLLARGFLTIDGFDEYAMIEEDYRRRRMNLHSGYLIRALQLVMTNRCNLSCDYCFVKTIYNSEERSSLQCSSRNTTMSFETAKTAIEKMLEVMRKNGNKELYIEFFGGEPLLNWRVISRIMDTFKNGCDGDVAIKYSVTTNGLLLTSEMAKIFKKYNATVTVSIDSFDLNGRARPSCGKGSRHVMDGLRILKEYDNWVTVNSVISGKTVNSFDGRILIEKVKHYNVAMIGLILDLNLTFYESADNRDTALRKLWETYILGQREGIPVVGYWHQIFQQIAGKQPTSHFSGYKTCPAAGCKLSVEPEGHVFICKCCSSRIGHVSDIEMVLHSPQYETYALKAYRNAPQCAGCEIEGFCSGVCMGALEKKYNTIDTIENNSCDIYKRITRKLIENIGAHDVVTLPLTQSRKGQHRYG